jgi:hypothetical protein
MDNPEKLTALGKQEWTTQRNWQHWANKNGQPRETDSIGYTKHKTKTTPKKQKTQHNIGVSGQ